MNTPTPGDMSARLHNLLEAAVCPMKEHGCDGVQYPVGDPQGDYHGEQCQWCHERTEALSALSALPAAGGEVCNCGSRHDGDNDQRRHSADCSTYATPQPSAAEDSQDEVDALHVEWNHLPLRDAYMVSRFLDKAMALIRRLAAATPPPDAAVGAQGDALGELLIDCRMAIESIPKESAAKSALLDRIDAPLAYVFPEEDCRFEVCYTPSASPEAFPIYTHAAPAAGKGVDGLTARVSELEKDNANLRKGWDHMREAANAWADRTIEQEDRAVKAEAALTRQPVAGDGWRPVAEIADLPPTDQPECFLYFPALPEAIKRGGNRAIYRVGRPADFPSRAPTHYKPATPPAATPTDGGEG